MIRKSFLPILLLFSVVGGTTTALHAQTEVDLGGEAGGRFALAVDKKLAKGLHLRLEEEVRFDNNFASFDRFHTTLGLTCKLSRHFKAGLGYSMINPYGDGAFKGARHRAMLDATCGLHLGDWRLSLKERFQATYRTGDMNIYQSPRTALTLKSRLKLQYNGFRRVEPYTSVELRNTLNAPVVNATYNAATDTWGYYADGVFTQKGEAGWFLDGERGVYVNRLRFALGMEYRISRQSSIDICLMADRVMDKEIDANAEGTKLKSYTREAGLVGWLAVAYCYSL